MRSNMRERAALSAVVAVFSAACAEDGKRPNGEACDESAQCESGLCYVGLCLDPSGDDDADGLANGVEALLGSDPTASDSDGDGAPDLAEVDASAGGAPANRDSDGDGKPDIVESAVADADGDCVADQADADDANAKPNKCGPPDLGWTMTTAVVATNRGGWCAVAAGSKVVISSGLDAQAEPPDDGTVDVYDVTGETWARVQFPLPHSRLSCLGSADAAYFTGGNRQTPGGDPLNTVIRFEPIDDSFSTIFTFEQARFDQGLALCGQRLIVAGGTYLPQNPGSFASTARVDILDLQRPAPTAGTLSQPRGYMASAVIGNEAFFAGGVEQRLLTQFTTEAYATDAVDIFDCVAGTWRTAKTPHAHTMMTPHAATLGTRTYFSGGRAYAAPGKLEPGGANGTVGGDAGAVGTLDVYDAAGASWSSLVVPGATGGPGVVAAVAGRWLAVAVELAGGPALALYDTADGTWGVLGSEQSAIAALLVVAGKLVVVKNPQGQVALDLFTIPR